MTLTGGLAWVAGLAAAAPPVADERTALQQRLGTAEVAYAECLDEAAIDAAVALIEPKQAMPRVVDACAAQWIAYDKLLRRDHQWTLTTAPEPTHQPSPEERALTFKAAFEGATSRNYPQLLERARAWSTCRADDETAAHCLDEARATYKYCLSRAYRSPPFRNADEEADAIFAALDMCEPAWDSLAVTARLAGLSERERRRFQREMRARAAHAYRMMVEQRPKIREACASAEAGGCGGAR